MAQAPQQQTPDVVSSIAAMLAAERTPPPAPAQKAETPPPAAPQPEPQQPQPEAQPAPQEAPAADNAQVEGAQPAAEDAPPQIELSEDQLEAIELEVKQWGKDGKRVPVKQTIKELREGYMRLDDYSRNIQEVARQRDEVPQKIREGIEGAQKQYRTELQQLETLVQQSAAVELQGVDWNHLAANDPAKYVQLRNRADQFSSALNAIKAKQGELDAKAKQEQGEAEKKAAREARAKLEAEIPGFNDDLYREVMKAGEEFGFKLEEVAQWIDPRAIKLLHAVHEYKKLKPGNPEAKKVVVTPKVVKPGPASTVTPAQKRQTEAMERLSSSGRIEDAAAVIRGRL